MKIGITAYNPLSSFTVIVRGLFRYFSERGYEVELIGVEREKPKIPKVDVLIYVGNPDHTAVDFPSFVKAVKASKAKKIAYVALEGPLMDWGLKFLELFDFVVGQSNFVCREIRTRSVDCTTVYVGVEDVERAPKAFDVIFVSAILEKYHLLRKGFDIFLGALPHFSSKTIVVNSAVAKLMPKSIPHFIVHAPTRQSIRRAIGMSKVLAFPSRSEGFGIPPLECAKSGCVPVCLDVPAVNEMPYCQQRVPAKYRGVVYLKGGNANYIYDADPLLYGRAVRKAVEEWENLVSRVEKAAEKFTVEEMGRGIEQFIK